MFEAVGSFNHFFPCQEVLPFLTEGHIQHGSKEIELVPLRTSYIQGEDFGVFEMWECEWWRLFKTTSIVKQHIRESISFKRPLTIYQLLEELWKVNSFRYIQCNIQVPESFRSILANNSQILKNTLVSENDIGNL